MTFPPASNALRLSLFYAAFFAVIGIQQPFWPVWLTSRGLSATEIGTVLAVGVGVKMFSTPFLAHFADRDGHRRRWMRRAALASLASFALFGVAHGFWPILAISLLFYACWPPIMSLAESVTMMAADREGIEYGRIRLWGSLSFIVLAVATGRVLVDQPPAILYWLTLVAVAATLAACWFVPDERARPHRGMRSPLLDVLKLDDFRWLILATGLVQGSHAVYFAFGTLYWQRLGYSDWVIGGLWAEGVIAEIILFAAGGGLIRRLGVRRLLMLAGAAATVRWTATGVVTGLPALILLQALHAFSFGAAHLAAMHAIARRVPVALSATAQSLYSGLVWGLSLGLALFAAGHLYAALAGLAYLPMAGMALVGAVLALRPPAPPPDPEESAGDPSSPRPRAGRSHARGPDPGRSG